MISFSNGVSSGDVLTAQSLINRDMLKCKPRKVSATRTFPARCAPIPLPNDVKKEEYGCGAALVSEVKDIEKSEIVSDVGISETLNIVKKEENGGGVALVMEIKDVEKSEIVTGFEISEALNLTEAVVEKSETVGDVGISKIFNLTEVVVENSDITDIMDIDEDKNHELEIGCELVDSPTHVGEDELAVLVGKGLAFACAFEGQVSEVMDTHVEIEEVESLDALAGEVTMTPLDDLKGDSPKEVAKAEVPIWVKDKCRPRRVSGVRDYPPNCKPIVISVGIFSDTIKIPGVDAEALDSRNNGAALREIIATPEKECPVEIQDVHVSEEIELLSDGPVSADLLDVSIEKDSNTEKRVTLFYNRREKPERQTECNDVCNDSNDRDGGQLGNVIVIHSSDDSDNVSVHRDDSKRAVVHGLMAAPNSPWTKGNFVMNASHNGTSEKKVRSKKRKSKIDPGTRSPQAGPSKKRSFLNSQEKNAITQIDVSDHDADDECPSKITPIEATPLSVFKPGVDNSNKGSAEPQENEVVPYAQGEGDIIYCDSSSADENDREVVNGLVTEPETSKLEKGKKAVSVVRKSARKVPKKDFSWRGKSKAVAKKSIAKRRTPTKKGKEVALSDDKIASRDTQNPNNASTSTTRMELEVRVPPFGPNNHNHGDARNKVRETLRFFHSICRKLLQNEEANSSAPKQPGKNRIDLQTAKIIKERGKEVNSGNQFIGAVPGVEVGDEFQYRVELAVVGIHRLYQAGIDWIKQDGKGKPIAISIVASGGYDDDMENADVLKYSGQGGNLVGKGKSKSTPEDQKLERGNLALSNSAEMGTPVRVIRGWKETKAYDPEDSKSKTITTYVYDGLYTVEKYWTEKGSHGKLVFMFQLRRNPDQPELAWKELKKTSKFKTRPGLKVTDVSGGQEPFPILAINTLNDENPPKFNYVSKMMYPDWFVPIPPPGCDCTGRCSDSRRCACGIKNGGIPYTHNGAIVEVRHLVYECGPHCKCPPSCYNRVSQRGLKHKLEIFKTESRGWGLRCLTSIPSGSFICEYAGELLKDVEAEKRIGSDEYLFDIGQNYTDSSLNPEEQAISVELAEEGGEYTIDAGKFGNVGRFINHSCSPNLYAQNVIYDHDDMKMPHVMLFAAEQIPPLQELTYHYNYKVDEVCDAHGNVKVKKCYCGSAECTGRMY